MATPRFLLAFLLLAVLSTAACGGRSGPTAATPTPATLRLEDVNVLLVVVDTLGAEHVGCLNPTNPRLAGAASPTPNLDRLAAGGVLFRRAFSPAPWTQPAVASLLTGRMPHQHGLVHLFDVLGDGEVTLAELLHERGFATHAVVSHLLLEPRYGFGQGFEQFDVSQAGGGHGAVTSEKVTDAALAWLDARAAGARQAGGDRRPYFLFVHYFDPHYVYRHHPGFDRTAGYAGPLEPGMDIWELRDARPRLTPADVAYLVGLYEEEVAYTDHHLGRLLRAVAKGDGGGRKTLVVVAADHGEEFMRHGWIGHTRTLYDELLHVPLVVSLPGVIPPRQVEGPVSLLDVVPTLLALSNRPAAEATPWTGAGGVSLAPLLTGGPEELAGRDLFAEVSFVPGPDDPRRFEQKNAYKTALLAADWKLVHDLTAGGWQLFDRLADPEELRDLAAPGHGPSGAADLPTARPTAEAELRRRLAAWEALRAESAAARRPGALTPTEADLAQLRALGYLR